MLDNAQNIVVLNRNNRMQGAACHDCMKAKNCPAFATGSAVKYHTPGTPLQKNVRPGQTVLETGNTFAGFYLVKSGFFKSSFIDRDGEQQVTGFFFPGEMFGFDGMDGGRHRMIVDALDTGSVCKIPMALAAGNAGALWNSDTLVALLKIASESITRDREMLYALGKLNARRRFASFLLDISARMGRSGYDPENFRLCMSRNDIANYLCLAVETVSRLFTQFQSRGVIRVDRRDLRIRDRHALEAAAEREDGVELLFEKAS